MTTVMAMPDVTTTTTTTVSHRDDQASVSFQVGNVVWIYVTPIILIAGLVGNCLTVAVMRRRRLRTGSVAIYLVLIAIADNVFLVAGIVPDWLEAVDIVVLKKIHPATCKVEKFIFYTSGDIAIWLLVLFTFNRFIAVCFPLKKRKICTVRMTWILVSLFTFLAVTKNAHVFWTRGAEYVVKNGEKVLKSNCGRPTPEYSHFEKFVRPWIVFVVVSLLPFCLLTVFNVGMVKALLQTRWVRKASNSASNSASNRTKKKTSQASIMCLSVSVLFLVTIAPSIVLLIGRPYWTGESDRPNQAYINAKGVNNALVFINHSANFFLYCLTGKLFRDELCRMLRRKSAIDHSVRGAFLTSFYNRSTSRYNPPGVTPNLETDDLNPSRSTRKLGRHGAIKLTRNKAKRKFTPSKIVSLDETTSKVDETLASHGNLSSASDLADQETMGSGNCSTESITNASKSASPAPENLECCQNELEQCNVGDERMDSSTRSRDVPSRTDADPEWHVTSLEGDWVTRL